MHKYKSFVPYPAFVIRRFAVFNYFSLILFHSMSVFYRFFSSRPFSYMAFSPKIRKEKCAIIQNHMITPQNPKKHLRFFNCTIIIKPPKTVTFCPWLWLCLLTVPLCGSLLKSHRCRRDKAFCFVSGFFRSEAIFHSLTMMRILDSGNYPDQSRTDHSLAGAAVDQMSASCRGSD